MDECFDTSVDVSADLPANKSMDVNVEPIVDIPVEESASFEIEPPISELELTELENEAEALVEPLDDGIDAEHNGFTNDLANPNLFNNGGEYDYLETEHGKGARGSLEISDERIRNPRAQLEAGGEDREARDQGGHLIGTRFGGSPDSENLEAQDRDVNLRGFKGLENEWAQSLENGNNVFVNVEGYHSNDSERPDAFMGYSITEDASGNRTWDAFSLQNASYAEQEAWANTISENDVDNDCPNPMRDTDNFDENAYNEAMQEKTKS
jgi:hypothetical protein